MTIQIEDESKELLELDIVDLANKVIEASLEEENCPYEVEINLLLTTNAEIRKINEEYRNIDRETDVLSFPMLEYEEPSDFSFLENGDFSEFHPETGELLLGDIIISVEKAKEQALAYGHSIEREMAFLMAHSMLHLCGYDHMEVEEAKEMEEKQSKILDGLGIKR